MLSLAFCILILAASWRVFQKMGHAGWEGIIPLYNTYVLFQELYGSGWKMLLLLIPLYNIYLIIKFSIDLAHAFHQSTGFGVGLALLSPIFLCILGFGSAVYGNGSSAIIGKDAISSTIDQVAGGASVSVRQNEAILNQIKELNTLKENGIITKEEFQQKKSELLDKI